MAVNPYEVGWWLPKPRKLSTLVTYVDSRPSPVLEAAQQDIEDANRSGLVTYGAVHC